MKTRTQQDITDKALDKNQRLAVAHVVSVVSCRVRVFMSVDASHAGTASQPRTTTNTSVRLTCRPGPITIRRFASATTHTQRCIALDDSLRIRHVLLCMHVCPLLGGRSPWRSVAREHGMTSI